jgi:Tol biopolymer transport system component
MHRAIRTQLYSLLMILILLALSCTCFSSGAVSETGSRTSPPAADQSAPNPSETAAVRTEGSRTETQKPTAYATVESKASPFPELNDMGRIVFASSRNDGLSDVFLMNADGSDVRFLAGTPGSTDTDASWSPDGDWIAFISSSGGNFDIQRIRPDKTGLADLTQNPADESAYDWSPDGTQIVFDSNRDGDYNLYVMDADGSNTRKLTSTPTRDEVDPAWSPDGSRIAYTCAPAGAGPSDVCIMKADGSGQANLTKSDEDDREFAWSPDGSRLAFGSPLWPEEIWVMGLDGSGKQNLTDNPADDGGIAWSPDGTRIAFTSDRLGKNIEIFLMAADGSDVVQLTDMGRYDVAPVWSPDGTAIAFVSLKYQGAHDCDIFVVRLDGSGLTNLTSNPSQNIGPDWQP